MLLEFGMHYFVQHFELNGLLAERVDWLNERLGGEHPAAA
jgi:hypothetical protein